MMQEAVLDFRFEYSFWEMVLYAGGVHIEADGMVPLGNLEMGNLVLHRECWGVYICTKGFLSLYTTLLGLCGTP